MALSKIYYNQSFLKWLIVLVAAIVGAISYLYTDLLVSQLADRERRQVDLFAKVQERITSQTIDDEDLTFLLTEIVTSNDLIPVILLNGNKEPVASRNVDIPEDLTEKESQEFLKEEVVRMTENYDPIVIEGPNWTNYICYTNSHLVTQLKYAPLLQLIVLTVLATLAYLIFTTSRNAERERLWAGLAKETAHQLGTPISSLMAWVEYFRAGGEVNEVVADELDKDAKRLSMITSRFSNIGSIPVLDKEYNLGETVETITGYLRSRISQKVDINVNYLTDKFDLDGKYNPPLLEWVIENICKNAVDAMNGQGVITIDLSFNQDTKRLVMDISDTGKGIPKSKQKTVFHAGYTSKKRGWGLGLTLAKRIVESYHKGKISITQSSPETGTTFRICLPK
ncbi:sensor histidine kinase [Sediminitomix flava]|uniref:histidine kinase n=1 Tax=Sediminitomix flava TaxID=379075 RepID=A0A315Z644_SEDFL|nr:HAMP domain-containing sensor histidine kinase [Sediminitomix flava]PWJ39323.1 histidine kinase/DNA gyrase B/HSP90-like ATPase [Sediminitomix flava]